MKKHNIFVTFEGGEGTGKSTISKLIVEKLHAHSIDVTLTREPGGKNLPVSEDIRKTIMKYNNIDTTTELLLFEASRREHITKVIKPALANGHMVISDRFADSTFVYQGIVKGLPLQLVERANDIAVQDAYPHLTIIFDLDPKIGLKRIQESSRQKNRFDKENIEFHQKVREAFLDLKGRDKRYKVIDASKPINEVLEDVWKIITDSKIEEKSIVAQEEKTQEVINKLKD